MGMSAITRFKIAGRNVLKNRRRTLITVISIAVGFLALSLFEGYFTHIYRVLGDQAIVGERLGHLTVVKRGYFEKGSQEPREYAFDGAELTRLNGAIAGVPGLVLTSPRLSASGLVSNGQSSRIFIGEGIAPADVVALRGTQYADLPGKLDAATSYAGVVGSKLARDLGVSSGNAVVLMSTTIDGMVNAVDLEIGEVTNTGAIGTDDKFVLLSLEHARKLLGFDGADRVVLLFESAAAAEQATPLVSSALKRAGFDVEIKQWRELSSYYGQVKGLFDAMYLFISLVVAIVVTAGVINTMGMAISERTREIGTLRALGMRARTVKGIFVLEGVIIVLGGCLIGMLATYLAGAAINAAGISYTPPDSTVEADLIVELVFSNLFGSLFTLTVLAALASYFASRRAATKSIVGALAHV